MKSCQHASKNIGLFQNQVFRKKKKKQQPLNNVVQTKTATSTIKKRKEKTSFFVCTYTPDLTYPVLLALSFTRS